MATHSRHRPDAAGTRAQNRPPNVMAGGATESEAVPDSASAPPRRWRSGTTTPQAAPTAAPAPYTVRWAAISANPNNFPAYVAKAQGFLAEESLDLEVTYTDSSPRAVQVLASRDIDREAVLVFLAPPSWSELECRLRSRATDDPCV